MDAYSVWMDSEESDDGCNQSLNTICLDSKEREGCSQRLDGLRGEWQTHLHHHHAHHQIFHSEVEDYNV